MTLSFNLIDQPWIPCVTMNGDLEEVGLRDLLLNAPDLQAIACETPLLTASILPVALAILHRVFGPEGIDEWEDLWEQGSFPSDPLEAYFQAWYERFDLFHPERPFYQMRDERVKPKPIIHLIHSIGNTATLFTHRNDESGLRLSPPEAARHLIAAQGFRTAGLSGLPEKFTDSPLTRGVLFWAYGETVFETLMLNLIRYPDEMTMPFEPTDMPNWEQPDINWAKTYPEGYLDYLTWMSNRIWLIPIEVAGEVVVETMTIAPGLQLSGDVSSPQKRYERNVKDDSWRFLYFNTQKGLWRDYHSLLALDSEDIKPPRVVDWLADLAANDVLDEQSTVKLTATGMLADQAKPIFYRQELLPLHNELLRNQVDIRLVEQAVKHADDVAGKLRIALNTLADHVLKRGGEREPDKNDRKSLVEQWDVITLYWTRLESHFWTFVEALSKGDDGAVEEWQAVLQHAARTSLEDAGRMSGNRPAALRGQVEAERRLNAGIKQLFGKKKEK